MKMQRNYKKTVELILIFCSVLFLFISPTFAWLSGWDYRQAINISNTAGDLTNYQVRIDLNSSNVGSNFNWSNNGSDIRFTNSTDDELNYWIESWNSSSQEATIWVNVTSLSNNTNTTIYMYYGNPSASSVSDGEKVFEFFDDFDDNSLDTNKWSVYCSGADCSVTETNGELYAWSYNYNHYCVNTTISFSRPYISRFKWKGDWSGSDARNFYIGRHTGEDNIWRYEGFNYLGSHSFQLGLGRADAQNYTSPAYYLERGTYQIYELKWVTGYVYGYVYNISANLELITSGSNTTYNNLASPFGFRDYAGSGSNVSQWFDWILVRKYADPEPTVSFGSEEHGVEITINDPKNQTYYTTSIPVNISTYSSAGVNYQCNITEDGNLIGETNQSSETFTTTLSKTGGSHNVSCFCVDANGLNSSDSVNYYVWMGLNISVYYDNGTEATNWNVSITNGTDSFSGTYNNSALLEWNTIPYGEINITVDDGSDTLYYYQNSTNITNNETNYQELNFTLTAKGNNTVTLTADPSWQVKVGTQVTISCSALETTPTLYKDGIIVSSPYTSTYAFGTYIFNCSTEETANYRPTSIAKTLNVIYPYGCINTEYGNQTFAYYSVVYTDYNLTTLNFTGLVNQSLVKSDLSDIYAYANTKSNNLTVWTNTTNGYYVIINNTGYTNFTILFGNYFINNTGYFAGTHALTDIVEFSVNEYDKKYTLEFFDEITGEQGLPPNSTKYLTIYCSGGTASNLEFNSSKITFATSSLADEVTVYVEYSPQERYSRTVIPESAGYYKMFLVDANNYQVAQMLLTVDDYTGEFGSNTTILKVKKETQGVLSTITERRLDAESKAIVYLIVDDKYSVYVDNGQEERGIGLLYVDTTDLTKTITIGTSVSLNTVGDFKFILGYNNQTNTIYMRVSDPLNQTLNASIWIYNYTSGELLYHASSTNHTTIEFTYIVPDVNGTYRVEYHIAHSIYGEHSISGGQIFALENLFPTSFPFEFPFAGDVQSEIGLTWQLFVVVIILIGITMMFGAVNGSFAGVFIVIMGYVMSFMGWWNPNPMIMATALIFAIVNLIAERLRRK
ncbi:MAG: hypothetical protein DRP10_03155 [Candidatus Aenigmatarchaeota archaeon]|nr:MAG: hypothetical protein DRP10_03155 [Candidatus Aenigmarchaeota archaeon]